MRTAADRFWSRVEKTDACWLWRGCVTTRGYGQFVVIGSRKVRAHRFSWELANGFIPLGLCVLHRCDVRICVRPDHLFIGTVQDNSDDMVTKGRSAFGVRNAAAKLTDEQVIVIRRARLAGVYMRVLAERFGVSMTSIDNIARSRKWRHLPSIAALRARTTEAA